MLGRADHRGRAGGDAGAARGRRRGGAGPGRAGGGGAARAVRRRASRAGLQWCDRRLLARMNRRTLDRLRREIEPVTGGRLHPLPARAGSTCARAPSWPGATGLREVIAAAAGLRGGGRGLGAGDPAGAGGRLRPGLAGRPVPGRRGGVGAVRAARRGDADPDPGGAHRPGRPPRPGAACWPRADGPVDDDEPERPRRPTCSRFLQAAGASFLEDIVHGRAAAARRGRGGAVGAGGGRAGDRRRLRGPAQPAAAGVLARRRQRPPALVRPLDAPAGASAAAWAGRWSLLRRRPRRRARRRRRRQRAGRPAGGAGPPVRAALGRGVPGSAAPRAAGAALARPGAGLPPAGDAGRAARRPPGGRLRGRAVRRARGGGGAAGHPPRPRATARCWPCRPATR